MLGQKQSKPPPSEPRQRQTTLLIELGTLTVKIVYTVDLHTERPKPLRFHGADGELIARAELEGAAAIPIESRQGAYSVTISTPEKSAQFVLQESEYLELLRSLSLLRPVPAGMIGPY